jgi:hypothetical protein
VADKKDGGPVFPHTFVLANDVIRQTGMSVRDVVAVILCGLVVVGKTHGYRNARSEWVTDKPETCECAFEWADAFLKARGGA